MGTKPQNRKCDSKCDSKCDVFGCKRQRRRTPSSTLRALRHQVSSHTDKQPAWPNARAVVQTSGCSCQVQAKQLEKDGKKTFYTAVVNMMVAASEKLRRSVRRPTRSFRQSDHLWREV